MLQAMNLKIKRGLHLHHPTHHCLHKVLMEMAALMLVVAVDAQEEGE